MGFLSKLLGGDKSAEKAAKDLLNGLFGSSNSQQTSAPSYNAPSGAQSHARDDGPSGASWGPVMPAEENQYNFSGPYYAYFEGIFSSELPALRFEREFVGNGKRVVYTFFDGAVRRLAVELLSDSCSPYKLRRECERAGIPYLRFYYDHPGWWNTRSYVADRLRRALGRTL